MLVFLVLRLRGRPPSSDIHHRNTTRRATTCCAYGVSRHQPLRGAREYFICTLLWYWPCHQPLAFDRALIKAVQMSSSLCENSEGIRPNPNFEASDVAECQISQKIVFCATRSNSTARFHTASKNSARRENAPKRQVLRERRAARPNRPAGQRYATSAHREPCAARKFVVMALNSVVLD